MEIESNNPATSKYLRSLGDDKREFALDYLAWINGGRLGDMPSQGRLSLLTVRMIARTLDGLETP